MIYYKDSDGGVYAYDSDKDRKMFDVPGLIKMGQDEVGAHVAALDYSGRVPERVTMRQARLALHAKGLLPSVDQAISALDEPDRTAGRIEWEFAGHVDRSSQFVAMLGAALALGDDELDSLFRSAAGL